MVEQARFNITVDQLHAWATERERLYGLVDRAKEIGREITVLLCQGEWGREQAEPLLAELMRLGVADDD